MPHFTLTHSPTGPLISVLIGVSVPRFQALTKAGQAPPQPVQINALVDTGASHTALDPTVITALGLATRRIAHTITPSTGTTPHKCYTYDVSIHIPMGSYTSLFSQMAWEVTGLDLKHQGFEMLLGRDILAHGILIYDGKTQLLTMAF